MYCRSICCLTLWSYIHIKLQKCSQVLLLLCFPFCSSALQRQLDAQGAEQLSLGSWGGGREGAEGRKGVSPAGSDHGSEGEHSHQGVRRELGCCQQLSFSASLPGLSYSFSCFLRHQLWRWLYFPARGRVWTTPPPPPPTPPTSPKWSLGPLSILTLGTQEANLRPHKWSIFRYFSLFNNFLKLPSL